MSRRSDPIAQAIQHERQYGDLGPTGCRFCGRLTWTDWCSRPCKFRHRQRIDNDRRAPDRRRADRPSQWFRDWEQTDLCRRLRVRNARRRAEPNRAGHVVLELVEIPRQLGYRSCSRCGTWTGPDDRHRSISYWCRACSCAAVRESPSYNVSAHRRRAWLDAGDPEGAEARRRSLFARSGLPCIVCGDEIPDPLALDRRTGRRAVELEHWLPGALGGSHEPVNLWLAHRLCNARKHDHAPGSPQVLALWAQPEARPLRWSPSWLASAYELE